LVFIQKSSDLKNAIRELQKEKFIAIDTEFIRTNTYYPIVSLIQLATSNKAFAIDLLADIDFSELKGLLVNPKIIKIFHSARQDLEAIFVKFKVLPSNIFDTQVAAQFLGYSNAPSYETLVKDFLGIQITKDLQFSDWLIRPLAAAQLDYAINDVKYLRQVYPILLEKLKEQKKLRWAEEEFKNITYQENNLEKVVIDQLKKFIYYKIDEGNLKKILLILKARESLARARNALRTRIINDRDILKVIDGETKFLRKIKNLDLSVNDPQDDLLIKKVLRYKKYNVLVKNDLYKQLKILLEQTSLEHNIAQSLIANSEDLLKVANNKRKNIKILSGWRKEIFGEKIMQVVENDSKTNKKVKSTNKTKVGIKISKSIKWFNQPGVIKLFQILGEENCRFVGGCVRDILCEKESEDIDIATTLLPEEVIRILSVNDIKVIPTGLKHGTVTALLDGRGFEITTLRKDVETDGRHAKIEFTNHWEEDANRRDFTINAMYLSIDGTLYDYCNGEQDLKNKLVKFIGDPEERIKEDYLRILRYFRFISYFGVEQIDNASIKACAKFSQNLDFISGERIRQEFFKIAKAKHFKQSLLSMFKSNILVNIGLEVADFKILDSYFYSTNPIINLAAIISNALDSHLSLLKIRNRWKLSNKEYDQLEFLLTEIEKDFDMNYQRKVYYAGKENYRLLLELLKVIGRVPKEQLKQLFVEVENWVIPKFPIVAKDLIDVNFTGPEIGKTLKLLESRWVDSNFALSKMQLMELVDEYKKRK
jgi:poly(A) polymerase